MALPFRIPIGWPKSGRTLGRKALWVEVNNSLHLPRWHNTEGMCFLCKATPHRCQLEAGIREGQPWGICAEVAIHQASSCPHLALPLFKQACLKLDWLHCAGQGVTTSLVEVCFAYLWTLLRVANFDSTIEIRRGTVWHLMERFFKDQKEQSDKLKSCLWLASGSNKQLKSSKRKQPLSGSLCPGWWSWCNTCTMAVRRIRRWWQLQWPWQSATNASPKIMFLNLLTWSRKLPILERMWHGCMAWSLTITPFNPKCNYSRNCAPKTYSLPRVSFTGKRILAAIWQAWLTQKEVWTAGLATSKSCLLKFCANAHLPSLMAFQAAPGTSSASESWCCKG